MRGVRNAAATAPTTSEAPPKLAVPGDGLHFTRMLDGWHEDLSGSRRGRCWRFAAAARSSRWSVAFCLLWLARLAVDIIQASGSDARRIPLRQFSGIYSCLWAVLFYVWRGRGAGRTFAALRDVSAELESCGAAETKTHLASSRRRLRLVSRFYYFLGLTQVAGVTQTIYTHRGSAVTHLLLLWPHGWLLNWLLYLTHTLAVLSGLFAYYTMMAALFALFGSCSVLFRALGNECACAARVGRGAVTHLARQHARLLAAAAHARLLFADLFAHIVSTLLILPLLGTVELLVAVKDVDSLTLATFAVIGTIFVPICLTGQELEDSSSVLRSRLYEGPWLEEAVPARRVRAHLMLGAGLRASMAVGGLGPLNAPSCLRVVNRWFSFLNVFINAQGQGAAVPVP